MKEGEEQDFMEYPTESYLKLIDEKLHKITRSAYVCVERRGKIYHLFDAERIPLGRMCTSIAQFVQGKHKPIFRHDRAGFGDVCVVVNADKIKLTGRKAFYKSIKYHTGYIGHLKTIPYKRMMIEKPEQLIFRTVSKMLPKNRLREENLKLLQVFRGPTHPLTNHLPNFGYLEENYDHIIEKVDGGFTAENSVILYETGTEGPEEFKDFKREIDHSIEIPFSQREYRVTMTPENKKVIREFNKFHNRFDKRYKEHKVKPYKKRSIIEDAKHGTVFVNRDWQYKKLGVAAIEAQDEIDED